MDERLVKKISIAFFIFLAGACLFLLLSPRDSLFLTLLTSWMIAAFYLFVKNKVFAFMILVAYSLVFLVLQTLNAVQFVFLPQVLELLTRSPFEVLMSGHIWGPRYLVVYPAVLMSNFYQVDIDVAFTIYNIILFFILVIYSSRIGQAISEWNRLAYLFYGFLTIGAVVFLSLVMNGRLVSAFLGMTIILFIQISVLKEKRGFKIQEYFLMFIGFFLSTVSSGTMMITLLQIIIVTFLVLKENKQSMKFLFIFYGVGAAILSSLILSLIAKNLAYFGGGITGLINMLSHGFGKFLLLDGMLLLLVIPVFVVVLLLFVKYYQVIINRHAHLLPVFLSLPVCVFGGLFGLSTALMIIPSIILMFGYFSIQFLMGRRETV